MIPLLASIMLGYRAPVMPPRPVRVPIHRGLFITPRPHVYHPALWSSPFWGWGGPGVYGGVYYGGTLGPGNINYQLGPGGTTFFVTPTQGESVTDRRFPDPTIDVITPLESLPDPF